MASTSEEIQATLNEDIYRKSLNIYNRSGIAPFYDGFSGFSIEDIPKFLRADKIICRDYQPRRAKKLNKKQQVDLED